ncbi:MAG: class I SAM-dependent methyltransferase [Spirochaetota bacterium]
MGTANGKFDPEKYRTLNDPRRLEDIPVGRLWESMGLRDPRVLVDIGAGTGLFSRAFAAYVPGGTVYACDISETMVEWMKQNVCPGYPNIVALRMRPSSVPLADRIADAVYMINVHHELDAPGETLREAFRLLKEGGRLCIVDWKKAPMPEGPPLHARCAPEEVERQAARAGFKAVTAYDELPKHFLVVAGK